MGDFYQISLFCAPAMRQKGKTAKKQWKNCAMFGIMLLVFLNTPDEGFCGRRYPVPAVRMWEENEKWRKYT
jgi:hypothetical protein